MLDPKLLRQEPEVVAENLAKRGFKLDIEAVKAIDQARKALQVETQELQAKRNALSKQIGQKKSKGEDASDIMIEVGMLGDKLIAGEAKLDLILKQEPDLFYRLPNTIHYFVPDGRIKYELDWLLKMQQSNGSVLSVVGGGALSPPSTDVAFRKYGPANTSAALTCAAMFALAAMQYTAASQTAYATTLQTAANNAYNWAVANPNVTFNNTGLLAAGEQEIAAYDLAARKVCAAVYLYALTGTASYKSFVDANYTHIHLLQWTFAYPFEGPEQDALLYYTKTPGATASPAHGRAGPSVRR